MRYKIADLDDLYLAITRLTTHSYRKDKSIGSRRRKYATGFFYRNEAGNRHFLITSRHVIVDEDNNHFPNAIRLYLHTDPNDLTKNEEFDLHLYEGTCRLWLESSVPNYDVVALPLQEDFAPNAHMTVFSDDFFFPAYYRLSLGHQVMTLGYPLGKWYDRVHNLPIIRSGIISSPYPIPYNNYPYCLVESRLHPGTSGAPVITAGPTRAYQFTKKETIKKEGWGPSPEEIKLREVRGKRYLLGINSRSFPFPKKQKLSDLNAVYFSEILKEFAK
jgi:hypothetical protein